MRVCASSLSKRRTGAVESILTISARLAIFLKIVDASRAAGRQPAITAGRTLAPAQRQQQEESANADD
ncbi:hypothetical protein [Lignipirellula cremea]|uniref:hypothetical protein n=1 Tax=Lignipirellula cremea TaxID=2528010 RepID=UPI0011A3D632|nr:hypothetical protein [Lignipirellula cremea]